MLKCLKCKKPIESQKQNIHGLHISCFRDWFQLKDFHEFSSLDPKSSSSSDPYIKPITDSFYHGKYQKYSARLGSTTYILKVQEKNYPDLPAVEYICNSIASLLKLEVPEYYLIRYQTKNIYNKSIHQKEDHQIIPKKTQNNNFNPKGVTFVTRNFMQDYKGGTLHHIYKFLPKGEKNYNCKNIINVLLKQTRPLDSAKFVEFALFDSLIGNNDRHGRNLGIIETAKHKRLAPMYDNPSYFGIASNDLLDMDFNISCAIKASFSKKPKLPDYIKEFKSLGFEKVCLKFLTKAVKKSQTIIEAVQSSEISKKRKKAFIKFLQKQLKSMEDF